MAKAANIDWPWRVTALAARATAIQLVQSPMDVDGLDMRFRNSRPHDTAQHSNKATQHTAQNNTHSTAQHTTAHNSTTQHSTAHNSTQQHNTAQHSTQQHTTAQHSTAQHTTAHNSTTQHSTAHNSTQQHNTAQHSTQQHTTAQHTTAQHNTAQHSTAHNSTAQHSTAQHSTAHKHSNTATQHARFWDMAAANLKKRDEPARRHGSGECRGHLGEGYNPSGGSGDAHDAVGHRQNRDKVQDPVGDVAVTLVTGETEQGGGRNQEAVSDDMGGLEGVDQYESESRQRVRDDVFLE
eukprot:CAMPEP_0175894734 /NCGR_PEP_ID=MMETSP0107_2-20121207/50146_1 /TAXON_ID=195067 ORGANISM="Goniomonas pacifica, Strain CCMP1869" /NCGR_SAMPLE_ID=MMETSP0107_2 /ASSEMBLY_ACC=CAM_ASM_000203 /LENGTH=293 /DNA_ID=CAMNT_0017215839 /DNA_START=595 /DNA_END=1479 /DNA_ORIENTATION=+